jgi:hypothetical protein
MVDSIEHISTLREFVPQLRRCMKAGGRLYISTPNADAFFSAGDKWLSLYSNYEHVFYLSNRALTTLAGDLGFLVEKTWSVGIPVELRNYKSASAGRLMRLVREPRTAAVNFLLKKKYQRAAELLQGSQLNAILAKPIHPV